MPRTSKRCDVLRTLKDLGAVDKNFPLTKITSPPASLPRHVKPFKGFHVEFPSGGEAFKAFDILSKNPTFSSRSADLQLLDSNASIYFGQMMTSTQVEIRKINLRLDTSSPTFYFNKEWMTKPGCEGRRVTITGMPTGVPFRFVRDIVLDRYFALGTSRDFNDDTIAQRVVKNQREFEDPMEGGSDGVQQVPSCVPFVFCWPLIWKITLYRSLVCSRFVVSFKSVESASRAARQLNMTRYTNRSGARYLIRASVVW
ncbi:hypothetical protein BD324DRAFT_321948 [Kockovaella imperatae]|uniref:Uncharacterized protein n=1 Tax=Kockovaella imperatae TaxID=4999 RepID=A0A1Y1UP29_9TREE|nr:hypothetical protein BD324DRAFT_321948 [Kockovaella imperatae]ORX39264.1 hypothetical protein BD324DRAFT_321948 [Kockovaella imperatae]